MGTYWMPMCNILIMSYNPHTWQGRYYAEFYTCAQKERDNLNKLLQTASKWQLQNSYGNKWGLFIKNKTGTCQGALRT